jgi:uncharacterized membrane protein
METIKPRKIQWTGYWKGGVFLAFGLVLLAWLLNTPAGLLGKADAIGYAVCHRIDLRSFFLGERQLPLCARCSGMYLGAMLGLAFQGMTGRRREGMPRRSVLTAMALLVFAFGFDGINSFLSLLPGAPTLYEPQNSLRLFTGTGMGLVIALALFPAFNASVWRTTDPKPAIDSTRKFALLILLAVGLDLLLLLENPLLLYPLALASASGVLVLLTMVYTMFWLMVFRAEKRYNLVKELAYPLIGGVTLALIQIGLLDVVRFFFTGTWEGFHLG